jgi:hypothetical protein
VKIWVGMKLPSSEVFDVAGIRGGNEGESVNGGVAVRSCPGGLLTFANREGENEVQLVLGG